MFALKDNEATLSSDTANYIPFCCDGGFMVSHTKMAYFKRMPLKSPFIKIAWKIFKKQHWNSLKGFYLS